MSFGFYLHIPFCAVRCGYCDFNTYTASELKGAEQVNYAALARREIILAADEVKRRLGYLPEVSTVFFGGGTPTILPAADLISLLGGIRERFPLSAQAEISVEANPDTLDAAYADELSAAGFNRVSLGMQSAVPHVLAVLERTHRRESLDRAVQAVAAAGLEYSLDLIYGSPGESLADWVTSLECAMAYQPGHISAYALGVEKGTRLYRQVAAGMVPEPDSDLQADMYTVADELLADAGYQWYEISNFARTHRSEHNLNYWRGGNWWGVGPGAHSQLEGRRWWNVKHPVAYAQRLDAGQSPAAGGEELTVRQQELEMLMLRIRLREGLSVAELTEFARQKLPALAAEGLIQLRNERVVLTLKGRLLANTVITELSL